MASVSWYKMTKQTASAMQKHNGNDERVNLNHSNPDIDKNKSYLNYCIGCDDYKDAYQAMCKRVAEVDKIYPMKIRKDRKICVSLEIKCPQSIFDSGRQREFFEKSYALFQDFFGEENVHGACVHLDEIHPYIEDGVQKMSLAHSTTLVSGYAEWKDKNGVIRRGISASKLETKENLKKLNKAFCDMVRREFGVEYNTGEKAKHKTVEQLKAENEIETLNLIIKATKNVAQNLLDEKDKILDKIEELSQQRDSRVVELSSIPPRPQLPPPLPPDEPRPMREHRGYTRTEEKELAKKQKSWDKSHAKGGERWNAEQQHKAETEQKLKEGADWDAQYQPITAAKNAMTKAAAKIDEAEAAKRQALQMQKQAQAELERGRAEVEKGKRANDKRSQELDVEVGQRVQAELARTDKYQRFMATSAEWDKRLEMLYKDADKRNEKAFTEKVRAMQKGAER